MSRSSSRLTRGLEEHAAHQREDGGVGADAQRQGQDHGDRKPLRAHERVERNSQNREKMTCYLLHLALGRAPHVPMLGNTL